MNKKLNFSSRKAAVRKVLEHNIAPALVAKSVGISTKTMLRYLEEFYPVTDDRPYELVNAATTSLGEFPCGVKADTLVDVILYQDNELCTGMAMSFIWRGINRIKAYRVTKTKEDVIEMQRAMFLKDLKKRPDVDRFLDAGYCHLRDFNLRTAEGSQAVFLHTVSKSYQENKSSMQLSSLDLTDVLLVKPDIAMTKWVIAENYKFIDQSSGAVVDILRRNGAVSCRVPAVTVVGFKEKQDRMGYSPHDIVAIRECDQMYLHGGLSDMTFVNDGNIPLSLASLPRDTLIDVVYHTGLVFTSIALKDLDWDQFYNRPFRIVAWRLHQVKESILYAAPFWLNESISCGEEPTKYFGYKDPAYSPAELVETDSEGFDNISIVTDCVVAYRTGKIAHPVLVLKEKRPIEYMKICSLMGIGDEEGIKDVLRGIFDK